MPYNSSYTHLCSQFTYTLKKNKMQITLTKLKKALITMIDLKLKSLNIEGIGIMTIEEITEMIENYVESEKFRYLAVFDDRLDRSEAFATVLNKKTVIVTFMRDTDRGFTNEWEFNLILN